MKEEWKSIKDYEGLYEVSNLGNVKSLNYRNSKKTKTLKLSQNENGYLFVGLSKHGITKMFKVHRLVAKAFIPNPYNLPQINHLDCNRQNNRVDNLEWCSISDNIKYSYCKGTRKPIQLTKRSRIVKQYDLQGNLINIYESCTKAYKEGLGITPNSTIAHCCNHKKNFNTVKGFKWEYGTMEEYINFHKGARENEI